MKGAYLFIDNGTVEVVTDVRDDLFAGCCAFLISQVFDTMQFGYENEGAFIEQTSLIEIDLENEYILRLSGNNTMDLDY